MSKADQYGGLMGLWEAQRNPELVDADPELAAWANLETEEPSQTTSEDGVLSLDDLLPRLHRGSVTIKRSDFLPSSSADRLGEN